MKECLRCEGFVKQVGFRPNSIKRVIELISYIDVENLKVVKEQRKTMCTDRCRKSSESETDCAEADGSPTMEFCRMLAVFH